MTSAITPHRNTLTSDYMINSIRDALPETIKAYMKPERFVKVILQCISTNNKLSQCTPESIALSVIEAASLGLEPTGGVLGKAYLVPFNRKVNGVWVSEAKLMLGYRGLIELARRSSHISTIEAHVVYENDDFTLEYGLDTKLIHKPEYREPGQPIGAYSVSHLTDGGRQFEFMTIKQLNDIRERSKSAQNGPWVTDTDEMYRKTVVRRLVKYLPMTTELAQAMQIEASAEVGDVSNVLDVDLSGLELPKAEQPKELAEKQRMDSITAKLQEQSENKEPVPAVQTEQQAPLDLEPEVVEPKEPTIHERWTRMIKAADKEFGRDNVDWLHDELFGLTSRAKGWDENLKKTSIAVFNKIWNDGIPEKEYLEDIHELMYTWRDEFFK